MRKLARKNDDDDHGNEEEEEERQNDTNDGIRYRNQPSHAIAIHAIAFSFSRHFL